MRSRQTLIFFLHAKWGHQDKSAYVDTHSESCNDLIAVLSVGDVRRSRQSAKQRETDHLKTGPEYDKVKGRDLFLRDYRSNHGTDRGGTREWK